MRAPLRHITWQETIFVLMNNDQREMIGYDVFDADV